MLLCSCGFKLRGQHLLPCRFHRIKISSATPYGDFESTMRRTLIEIGANVTRMGTAPVTLQIISAVLINDVPTIGGSNQSRVYIYYYQVVFQVVDSCNNVLLSPRTVTATEKLIVNAGTALESTNQLEVMRQELQFEAAHMIINNLNAISEACHF